MRSLAELNQNSCLDVSDACMSLHFAIYLSWFVLRKEAGEVGLCVGTGGESSVGGEKEEGRGREAW